MKKNLLPVIAAVPFLLFLCCSSPPDKSAALQEQIDSLQKKLDDTYRPGFGEFMSGIQVHHAKLWFAGKEQNWKLADFELHEIMETVDDLKKYQSERRESDKLIMLDPVLQQVNDAIQKQDTALFRSGFTELTNTCNTCHQSVNFGFNVIRIPDTPPFSNQSFKKAPQQ